MKKAISILLALIMVLTLFAGCAQKPGEAPDPAPKDEAAEPAEKEEPAEPSGEIENVTYFCNVGAYLELLTKEVAKWNEGEGKAKGVNLELISNIDAFESTAEAMMKSGNFYDIVDSVWAQPGWISNGWFRDLNEIPQLKELVAGYEPYLVDGLNILGGKLVSLPLEILPIKMAVNTDLFEQNNLELPKTWDDVKNAAKVITENGKGVDFGYGFTDAGWSPFGWRRLCMKSEMSNTGVGWFNNTTGTYDFGPFKQVVELHRDLYQEGCMFPDPSEISIDGVRAQFSAGHVGMIVAPAYDISVYNTQFPAECNWTIVDCPSATQGGSKYKGVMLNRGNCGITTGVTDERMDAVAAAFAFLNSDELLSTLYANCAIIPHKDTVRESTTITNPLKNWDIMSDCTDYGYVNLIPDGLLSLEGDTYAQVFEAIMTDNTTWDDQIEDLNARYNAAYQAGVADGTINDAVYKLPYSLEK